MAALRLEKKEGEEVLQAPELKFSSANCVRRLQLRVSCPQAAHGVHERDAEVHAHDKASGCQKEL